MLPNRRQVSSRADDILNPLNCIHDPRIKHTGTHEFREGKTTLIAAASLPTLTTVHCAFFTHNKNTLGELHMQKTILKSGFLASLLLLTAQVAQASLLTTYVTGEDGSGANVIFKVVLDPTVVDSGVVTTVVTDPAHRLDGIDFVPGTGSTEVAVGAQTGNAITRYNVGSGAIETPFVAAAGATIRPSTILSTSSHIYYIENQFGFGTGPDRIIRVPVGGGATEVVFDGSAVLPGPTSLINFEGLEIFGDRLFFFADDPTPSAGIDERALISIGLSGGVWDGSTLDLELGGLFGDPSGDGSDELDYDSFSGYLFGTNIRNGEIIAFDPVADIAITSPGAITDRFIDSTQIGAVPGDSGLSLLLRDVDGIRADGEGHLIFTSLTGAIGSIDIDGVLADGAGNADVLRLYDSGAGHAQTGFSFDDLTPFAVPEPPLPLLFALTLLGIFRSRRKHH